MGAGPNEVAKMYHTAIVGNPVLTPQWALGWNQCKYGYKNTQEMVDSVQGYKNFSIPLDTQWVDIDYMNDYQDFTFDQKENKFGDLPSFVTNLTSNNMHFIPIVDLGIAKIKGYSVYDDGVTNDVFLKAADKKDFVGQVWPGDSVYPDFFKSETVQWW